MTQINRRGFLRLSGVAAALLAGGGTTALLGGCAPAPPGPIGATLSATAKPAGTDAATDAAADVEITLTAVASEAALLPGRKTRVLTYHGELVRGDPASLQTLSDTYLGPLIRARQGQKVRIHFTNGLDEKSIIHWHGLRVPSNMDGHPSDVIEQGLTYTYDFPIHNRAGTYWYHPHPHQRTGYQAYHGLAGLFLVTDHEEEALGLPSGAYDVPLVIQDRTFDKNNQFVYLDGGMMGGMMDRMMGFLGDRILVNGRPDFILPVATHAYRLRLLNGSNSRVYKLAWSNNTPLTVIATDGGLLAKPVQRQYVMLGPGERIELWADFSGLPVGAEITLQSLEFSGAEDGGMGGGGMGGMMGSTQSLPNGAAFPVMKIRVEREDAGRATLPAQLSSITRYRPEDAVNASSPRTFKLSLRQMQWQINGRVFEMDAVADDEVVQQNALEAWELIATLNPGEMMDAMGMIHPIHVHGTQFQVIERQVLPELAAGWNTVRDGYVDDGWKDTVLVMPGERVKLLLKFEDYAGMYLYHCHNLEHEDQGMMRNLLVKA